MSSKSKRSSDSVSSLRRRFYLVCRLALAVLMIGVGVSKAAHMEDFAEHIGDFGIVPSEWDEATAWTLVVTEVTLGLGLLFHTGWAALGLTGLLIGFIAVLGYGEAIGLDIECGCYGESFKLSLRAAIAVDAVLLCLSVFLVLTGRRIRRVSR